MSADRRAADRGQDRPLVSLILCSYRRADTLDRALAGFAAQRYQPLEIVLVDSSPDDRTERIVAARYPQIRFWRHPVRLLPNDAHQLGVERARGELFLFSDPDMVAPADWVETLVAGWRRWRSPVAGAIACDGDRWLDLGIHLGKFDQWLPAGEPRPTAIGPSAALLCSRADYERAGGFPPGKWLGDSLFSWRLAEMGRMIWFLPQAVAAHQHRTTLGQYLQERHLRGREFGGLRIERRGWNRVRTLLTALVTILPLRWVGLTIRSLRAAWSSDRRLAYLLVSPIAAAGHASWLAGEAVVYLRRGILARTP